jgi:solute carrier family 13 (sodium-dependent dicarboxylate transporter), member 2/3/5
MRTLQEAYEAVEAYSPAEEQFNRRRRTFGLLAAPLAFGALLLLRLPGLSPEAHRMAAVMAVVIVLWITEALPMAATALLGPTLAVILHVAPARVAYASFADPIIFVFIGSFMLAEAMFVHGVDRRIAYSALSWPFIGSSGTRILAVYGGVATALSMWISNTATTAMMFPIGLAIVAHLSKGRGRATGDTRRFAMGMMLITSFGASVGGMATPVGTPPNLIGIGLIERIQHVHITFFQWMAVGVPVAVVLFGFLSAYFSLQSARGVQSGQESAALVREELRKLGPPSVGQRNVLIAFGVTVLLWTAPGLFAVLGLAGSGVARGVSEAVPESVAAMVGAMLLFLLPISWRARRFTLTWDEAVRIDWGIVLLYGGGLALGDLAFSTGLAQALGDSVARLLPSQSTLAFTALFTGSAIALSETTSNTAAANMIVPVAIAVSSAAGGNPLLPAIGATLGSSMGFIMPISTAPNAIVYSSGYVPIGQMMKHGVVLDLVAFVVIVGWLMVIGPILF